MLKKNINIIAFILSYIISRFLFYVFEFEYNIIEEGFNINKLIIDFGTWIVIFSVVYIILIKIMKT